MPGLVARGHNAFFFGHNHRFAGNAHKDFVARLFQFGKRNLFFIFARGKQSALVNHVRQIGAAHARRRPRKMFKVHVVVKLYFFRMHDQNGFALFYVRKRHVHLPVEAAGAQKRGIQNVRAVGRGKHDNAFFAVEAVHFDKHLVERLLALVVSAAEAGSAGAPDGVKFVYKDNGRRALSSLFEQIAYTACTHADEHFDKIASRNMQKRNVRFARNGARQKRFSRSGTSDQKHASGNLRADFAVFFRIFQKIDDFGQFFFRFFLPRNIGEGYLFFICIEKPRTAPSELHSARILHGHLPHKNK